MLGFESLLFSIVGETQNYHPGEKEREEKREKKKEKKNANLSLHWESVLPGTHSLMVFQFFVPCIWTASINNYRK